MCHTQALMAGLHRGMIWLPTVGQTSYDPHLELKTYSPRTKWFGSLCPQSSAWSLTLLSLNVNQFSARRSWYSCSYPWGNDSAVNTDGYIGCSSSLSLSGLNYLLAMGRAGSALPPCLGVQIKVDMLWFSWYLYCCWSYNVMMYVQCMLW